MNFLSTLLSFSRKQDDIFTFVPYKNDPYSSYWHIGVYPKQSSGLGSRLCHII